MYDGIEDFATKQWAVSLEGINGDQIKEGLRKCGTRKIANGSEDWPPTPAEFRAMCLPETVPAIHLDYVALPRPQQDPDTQRKALDAMRKALGVKGSLESAEEARIERQAIQNEG